MLTQRRFRGTNFPGVVFSNSAVCLERMRITLTKKEVLKEEGDSFDGVIEGTQQWAFLRSYQAKVKNILNSSHPKGLGLP